MFKATEAPRSTRTAHAPEGPTDAALRRRQLLVAAADPSPLRDARMAALAALTGEDM
ncbi:hypothetical protein [Streptomyces sp. NPDC057257]|uniref:hypothetical protein n=1 Tax=Streptomyces sp. NPDC057257 TaxID=3346071 RepID=UPI00362FBCC0